MKSSNPNVFGHVSSNQFEALFLYLHPSSASAHLADSCTDLFKIGDGPVIKQRGVGLF